MNKDLKTMQHHELQNLVASLSSQLSEANTKLNLIRKDEGMQNRMLELFETRRDSDERLKEAIKALEKIEDVSSAMENDTKRDVSYRDYELRAIAGETLTKLRK